MTLPDMAEIRVKICGMKTRADMEAAASRLGDAVMRNEKVAIFGDYDVDGACSACVPAGEGEWRG